MDESRFGLKTDVGKKLGVQGQRVTQQYQHKFINGYVFGAASPLTGNALWIETNGCNTQTFQFFLDELSKDQPEMLKVLLLDNAGWHKAKELKIPKNVRLLFIPPYCPEVNPIERLWQEFKRKMKNHLFQSWEQLMEQIEQIIKSFEPNQILSVLQFPFLNPIVNAYHNGRLQ